MSCKKESLHILVAASSQSQSRVLYTTLKLPKGEMAIQNLKEYFHTVQLRNVIYWCNADYVAR